MAKALIIDPSGGISVQQLDTYDQLSQAVGGYLEQIYFGDGVVAVLNEDGKALELPLNRRATRLAYQRRIGLIPGDWIAGTLLLFGEVDDDGEYTDVPARLLEQLLAQPPA